MNGTDTIKDTPASSKQLKLAKLQKAIEDKVIGQSALVEKILVTLLAEGHILLEGMPGLAKTRCAKAVADAIHAPFHRIQFTPDLLPSDLIGTEIYIHEKSDFVFRKGPIFNNILLADEINRAPAKVQSALLEAMEEKQVTVGHSSYPLPSLYMVIATQNPIEQEGTYNLPEAQLDRFMMHLRVDYPSHEEELKIILLNEAEQRNQVKKKAEQPTDTTLNHLTSTEELQKASQEACHTYVSPALKEYAVSLVSATRQPLRYDKKLAQWLSVGASPRATIALIRCAKALAWLRSEPFVTPSHIQELALPILRHRIIPTFDSEAEGVTRDQIIQRLIDVVALS